LRKTSQPVIDIDDTSSESDFEEMVDPLFQPREITRGKRYSKKKNSIK